MTTPVLAVERVDSVAVVTFDRPQRLNAFTDAMGDELMAAMDELDADDRVRAIVFTGRGRAFCAGADLAGDGAIFDRGDAPEFDMDRHPDYGGTLARRLFASTKPLIAAINGPAVGIGASLTLPMDVRLLADGARLGFVFTRRGLVPESCSSWFLPRVVGISTALEWVISGRMIDAQEALDTGLVRSRHPVEALLPAAIQLAEEMTRDSAPVAVALARRMMWTMLGSADPIDAHILDSKGIFTLGRGPDAHEGVRAFLEKRPARFPLRVSTDLPDLWADGGVDR
jgi:enoyl-CoA hydratase/carnithine racemase